MIYEWRLTVPKNTPQSAPEELELQVLPGRVTEVQVEFPTRCAGLAHVQIFHWERQIWPSNVDSSFTGDGSLLVFPESFDVQGWPYVFTLRAWNLDDTYPHTPIVRMSIETQGPGLLQSLLGMFGLPTQALSAPKR